MADIEFNCPQCQFMLVVDERGAGKQVNCPKCSSAITIPELKSKPVQEVGAASAKMSFLCPQCGKNVVAKKKMEGHKIYCPQCGKIIIITKQAVNKSAAVEERQEPEQPKLSLQSQGSPRASSSASHKLCPSCQHEVETEAVICVNCGTDLRTGRQVSTIVTPQESAAMRRQRGGENVFSGFLTQIGKLIKAVVVIGFIILGIVVVHSLMKQREQQSVKVAVLPTVQTAEPSNPLEQKAGMPLQNPKMTQIDPETETDAHKLVEAGAELTEIKRYADAFKYYKRAADLGDANGQFFLAMCYDDALGVAKDIDKAVALMRKAAEQGQPNAQFNIGLSYYYGSGVTEDRNEALNWYRKAAAQGNKQAIETLVKLQQNETDPHSLVMAGLKLEEQGRATDAFIKYKQAADLGSADGQLSLAMCYERGSGVAMDKTEAVKWTRRAAEQGHAIAQLSLGMSYHYGSGVAEDKNEAIKWYRKSAALGNKHAEQMLAKIAKENQQQPSAQNERASNPARAGNSYNKALRFNTYAQALQYAKALSVREVSKMSAVIAQSVGPGENSKVYRNPSWANRYRPEIDPDNSEKWIVIPFNRIEDPELFDAMSR